MRHTVNTRTWEGFLRQLKTIRNGRSLHFRGHSDSRWQLRTTLDRRGGEGTIVLDYYHIVSRIRPQVESFTGRTFELPPYGELMKLLKEYESFSLGLTGGRFPGYSFLIYLRHHGFPSPLLDWTRSPYIAAYFAFAPEQSGARRRSIYAWAESFLTSLAQARDG